MSSGGEGTETASKALDPATPPEGSASTPVDSALSNGGQNNSESPPSGENAGQEENAGLRHPTSPQSQSGSFLPQMYPPHLTPQQSGGYYLPVYGQPQVTPEPNSPANHHAVYDATSFLQQHSALGPSAGVPQPPFSPRVPPASPLFPRVQSNHQGNDSPGLTMMAPGTPNFSSSGLPYLSPNLGPGGVVYQGYGANYNANSGAAASLAEDQNPSWNDRNQQTAAYHPASPQPYVNRTASARSHSFDEMLPPAMLDPQDTGNPAYSPYGGNQTGPPPAGGTLFAQQQPWGYPPSVNMYDAPASPLQPRPSGLMPPPYPGVLPPAMGARPPLGPQGYYATSPGPPIQTTASNKGPDGANLFIFHIPNNFTNLDMYQLFCPYGNLLSVRIMVERDTGRSRGFGFVSYDNPESAAVAIKELNGYAVGNKRLKVQHKQIRSHDHQQQHHSNFGEGGYPRGDMPSSLPPAGDGWYDGAKAPPQSHPGDVQNVEGKVDENTESTLVGALPELPKNLDSVGGLTPLASLEPLRNALPDVGEKSGRNS